MNITFYGVTDLIDHGRWKSLLIALCAGLMSTVFGIWLLVKGIRGESTAFNYGIEIPRPLLIILGLLMQLPILIYILIGYYTGMFQGIIIQLSQLMGKT